MADLITIIDRLAERLGPVDGEPVPLDGGITNRNYRVRFGQRDCVLRLPGRDTDLLGIDRAAERVATERAAALGIAPPLVAADEECMVTEWLPGAPIDGARLRADPSSAARALRAFHRSGLQLPVRFWVPDLLGDYAELVAGRGGTLPDSFTRTRELVARIAEVMPLAEPVPCHDDLLPGNVLAADADPGHALLVDWEYAGMGHRYFDLGNLAVNNEFDEGAQDRLLEAYFDQPADPGRRAALRLMMLVSDAREAAWGVVQGSISELDFDFADYARQHFSRLERNASDPRLEEWMRAATP
ncbi:MAG TPA: choline/ethanolamine kinase family protein [Solirubrobacteraceae bacterium]|nr:choline/ethanolamine kinase family protein [Solirubrobacteraceae bacterium]